ncbi:MAG: nitroreductase [Candidatus Lokiarchaeota archaeon]|nr:nitroreductase [Candidatus Lokiarchaeota archaeon]
MDVMEAILKRRSIRAYLDTPVPAKELERIATAGLMAPSASNMQPWTFVLVTDPAKRQAIGKGLQQFIAKAPLIVVGTVDKQVNKSWNIVDCAIALQNMVLYCTSVGLGTCWIGAFNENSVRKACHVPDSHEIIALLTVGYASPSFPQGSFFRKDMADTAFLDDWNKPLPCKD